jgi:LysR family transcriptional regulator, glycine cleavage system transcriptional activator
MEQLPSIQTLRAFEAAARHGSYSAAANELALTHGAISHRIRELETRLGVRLFRRTRSGMVPTREAVPLLAQCRQVLQLLERAFPDRPRRGRSRLVVSVHPTLATRWLVPRMLDFAQQTPSTEVEIRSTADIGDFLAEGIDIAVRYGAGGWANGIDERLADEILFPVCAPKYQREHKIERPSDLRRCTLLRHIWQPWSPWLRAARLRLPEPTGGINLSDSAMVLEAAASGRGVALARGLFVRDDLESGRLVRLFDTDVADVYGYYAVWRAGETPSGAVQSFKQWLKDRMQASSMT